MVFCPAMGCLLMLPAAPARPDHTFLGRQSMIQCQWLGTITIYIFILPVCSGQYSTPPIQQHNLGIFSHFPSFYKNNVRRFNITMGKSTGVYHIKYCHCFSKYKPIVFTKNIGGRACCHFLESDNKWQKSLLPRLSVTCCHLYLSLFVTFGCHFLSLFVTFGCHFLSLFITFSNHFLSLSVTFAVTFCHFLSLLATFVCYFLSLSVTFCHFLSLLTVTFCHFQSLFVTFCCHFLSLSVTFGNIFCHFLSLSVTFDCHSLSLFVTFSHYLSLSVTIQGSFTLEIHTMQQPIYYHESQ